MTRLLFLDFDGVLNCVRWFVAQHKLGRKRRYGYDRRGEFDPRCVANLNRILFALPDVRIVVSSSWRGGMAVEQLAALLESVGVRPGRVIGKTGHAESRQRHEEISDWMAGHYPNGAAFAAVDDDTMDMVQLRERFFRTDRRFGLTREVARGVIAYLRCAR